MIRYEAPDGSLTNAPTPDDLRQLVLTSPPSYWQAGGNGEAVLTDTESRAMLCIKQPPETDQYLMTYMLADTYAVPHTGETFDEFVMDERGGDPFRVPIACLVDRDTAAEITAHFATTSSMLESTSWISWDDLPESYRFT